MNIRTLCLAAALCLTTISTAQNRGLEEEGYKTEYEATKTDYGFYGTTNAIFSESATIISTFSLTQHKPEDGRIYPMILNLFFQANAENYGHQEEVVKAIASSGATTLSTDYTHEGRLLLANNETVTLHFAITNLSEGGSHDVAILAAPIFDPEQRTNRAMFGEIATKLRRHDIRTLTIGGQTLNFQLLGLRSAEHINNICKKLVLAGCNSASFNSTERPEESDIDVSLFESTRKEKTIDELLFHALGCFPKDIKNITPAMATNIIRKNTTWRIDARPNYQEFEFTPADGYNFTYNGIPVTAEMCWDPAPGPNPNRTDLMPFRGYNYYFKLHSADKKRVKKLYAELIEDLDALGFHMMKHDGDSGDKEPKWGRKDSYRIETCYYVNVFDQYVITLRVEPYRY